MQPTQGTFLGITPVSSVSNSLYFLTLPLVSVMHVIYTSKGMSKKFGVRIIYRKIRYSLYMPLCLCGCSSVKWNVLHIFLQWRLCSELHLVERCSGKHWNRGGQLDRPQESHFRRQFWHSHTLIK